MDEVKVPEANFLPHVKGLKGPFSCLNSARYGIIHNLLLLLLFDVKVKPLSTSLFDGMTV